MAFGRTTLTPESIGRCAPPLKWAGGKRWQVPHSAAVGAARASPARRAVLRRAGRRARLAPERALLNDVNPHLINFYRWLQRGLRSSIRDGERRDAVLRAIASASTSCSRGEARRAEAAASSTT